MIAMFPLVRRWWGQTRSFAGGLHPATKPLSFAVSMKASKRLLSSSTKEFRGLAGAGTVGRAVAVRTARSTRRIRDDGRIASTTSEE
jgi:hypothetical protein